MGIGTFVWREHVLTETYSPLIVDANTMLSFTVAFQSFKPVSWRNTQNLYFRRRIQDNQFSARKVPKFLW
jgi:hypothetical protein